VSRLQIYVRRDDVRARASDGGEADGWQLFGLLDHGDFIGVDGYLFVTKTGELSVHVEEIELLAKALVPMPDKVHGISDPEIGRRRRYVDLIAGSLKIEREPDELTPREVFARRSKLITEMRHFLDSHGYVEVETPMLTPIASGAAARPFKTHHNALGIDLYARIAPELYLKRLLVGGFERVYELNRNFRNEGIGYRWNPEFTMLEFYCAYMDVNGMMNFCEDLLRTGIREVTGGTLTNYGEQEIDFGSRFERFSMKEAIAKYWHPSWNNLDGKHFNKTWLDSAETVLNMYFFLTARHTRKIIVLDKMPISESEKEVKLNEATEELWQNAKNAAKRYQAESSQPIEERIGRDIEFIFGEVVEPRLTQPIFITDFPKTVSPLSKASPADPSVAERFELFIAGMEIANGFSELNDPAEQYERFMDQQARRDRGDEEAMPMDEDYLRALAYGMPPAAGIGIGIDRLTMILTNRQSIRDVILFPHMRPPMRKAEEAQPDDSVEGKE
ncbi:MAG: lysine--tRNA ligase, partial [Pyrinomonadaceae bacterium]